jgi:hypothetical protein
MLCVLLALVCSNNYDYDYMRLWSSTHLVWKLFISWMYASCLALSSVYTNLSCAVFPHHTVPTAQSVGI